MAAADPLTAWALAHAAGLGLEVTRVTWPEEWLPGFFDYRVSLSAGAVRSTGEGMDRDEPRAFAKAVAEAIERAAMTGRPDRWATAAHPDVAGASRNAYLELLGIDRALCHHYCAVPMRPVPLESFVDRAALKVLNGMLRKSGLSLSALEMRPALDARCVVVFCWSQSPQARAPGFVAGFGTDAAVETAALHALLECLRSATSVFFGDAPPAPEEPLEELARRESPRWNYWMAKTPAGLDYVRSSFLEAASVEPTGWAPEPVSMADVLVREIDDLPPLPPGLPLRIVQASSDRLMRPRFGGRPLDGAALARLERFHRGPLGPISPIPHFYG